MTEDKQPDMYVTSVREEEGYRLKVHLGEDRVIPLSPEGAAAYAHAVLTACARAEYDKAVYHQISEMTDEESAGETVIELRKDLEPATYGPMTFTPGVGLFAGQCFVNLEYDGAVIGQIDIEAARDHAFHILQSYIVAPLDLRYASYLENVVGLESDIASNVVHGLAKYR